jgi:hypothetical protein
MNEKKKQLPNLCRKFLRFEWKMRFERARTLGRRDFFFFLPDGGENFRQIRVVPTLFRLRRSWRTLRDARANGPPIMFTSTRVDLKTTNNDNDHTMSSGE